MEKYILRGLGLYSGVLHRHICHFAESRGKRCIIDQARIAHLTEISIRCRHMCPRAESLNLDLDLDIDYCIKMVLSSSSSSSSI